MNHFSQVPFLGLVLVCLLSFNCIESTDDQQTKKLTEKAIDTPRNNRGRSVAKKNLAGGGTGLTVDKKTAIVPQKKIPVGTPEKQNYVPSYAWLDKYRQKSSIQAQIRVPDGYRRVNVAKGSFQQWLRGLPLLPPQNKVMLYNKSVKPYQAGAHRIINIDIGERDLQQCADAVIRLKAEYDFSLHKYRNIYFNYTSGDTVRFSDWAIGIKPKVNKNKVTFTKRSKSRNHSYANFRKYLTSIFYYAGTASLSKELKSQQISKIKAGDVFIKGGFPGHGVLVVDVAQHKESGKRIFLLAQSFMPAQSMHILNNFNDNQISPWYSEDFGPTLAIPEWTFDRKSLKRFRH